MPDITYSNKYNKLYRFIYYFFDYWEYLLNICNKFRQHICTDQNIIFTGQIRRYIEWEQLKTSL